MTPALYRRTGLGLEKGTPSRYVDDGILAGSRRQEMPGLDEADAPRSEQRSFPTMTWRNITQQLENHETGP